jgi:hypothetical protein
LAITPRLSVRPPDGHIRLMNVRAAESDVVTFLRAALADGAHAKSASDEERQQRKRRLLKGPREFRDMRDEIRSKSKS